jgi:hypothetical protein
VTAIDRRLNEPKVLGAVIRFSHPERAMRDASLTTGRVSRRPEAGRDAAMPICIKLGRNGKTALIGDNRTSRTTDLSPAAVRRILRRL